MWIVGSWTMPNASEHPTVSYSNQSLYRKPHNISLRWFGMVLEDLELLLHNIVSKGQPG